MKKKKSIQRFLFGNIMDEPKESTQNIYVFRFICCCMFLYTIEFILNELGIFIVDKYIFRSGYLIAVILAIIYIFLLIHFEFKNDVTKYIGITALTLIIAVANITLTYHMTVTITLPLIVAGMYSSKRVNRYTFIMVMISIVVITYGGYFFGLCDANMALLTATSLKNLNRNGIFGMSKINEYPIFTLGLFFVLPRCIIAIAFTYVSNIVNNVIRKSYKQAIHDSMTGLYNKNKLIEIMENETYNGQKIGIIYWDVNHLKFVNDTYGHQAGDQLIIKVAASIYESVGDKGIAFRYGGDEFLALIPKAISDDIETMINRWEKSIKEIQKKSDYTVSAAVGYAIGDGEDLVQIIAMADKNMYEYKQML